MHGRERPHLSELIAISFDVDHLLFTGWQSRNALFSKQDTVFRMRRSEVRFLDVRRMHRAAVFGSTSRIHLLLASPHPETHVAGRPTPLASELMASSGCRR